MMTPWIEIGIHRMDLVLYPVCIITNQSVDRDGHWSHLLVNIIIEPFITTHVSHVESLPSGGYMASYARVEGKSAKGQT